DPRRPGRRPLGQGCARPCDQTEGPRCVSQRRPPEASRKAGGVKVIIPAAGLGSRFLPLSRVVPKELLLFGDRPLIHHALREAERSGFEAAIIVVSPGKEAIKRYLTPDPELEEEMASRGNLEALSSLRSASELAARMRVEFVEQPEPRGLGDAVLRCAEVVADEACGVLLPDDVILGQAHWRELFALHARGGAACFC